MTDSIARRIVTIVNPQGLHARPADLFVRTAKQYRATVRVRKGNESVDGKSILGILTLAAAEGSQLEILVTGQDAEEALVALCNLVEQGFCAEDEPQARDSALQEASGGATPSGPETAGHEPTPQQSSSQPSNSSAG